METNLSGLFGESGLVVEVDCIACDFLTPEGSVVEVGPRTRQGPRGTAHTHVKVNWPQGPYDRDKRTYRAGALLTHNSTKPIVVAIYTIPSPQLVP